MLPTAKSVQKRTELEILDTLAELGGKLTAEEDIVFQGKKMILPETMTEKEAIRFLQRKLEAEEQINNFSRTFPYRPWDGAHATMSAMHRMFGMAVGVPIESLFGTRPPELLTINIGPNETTQVPWGALAIPAMPGVTFHLGSADNTEYGQVFRIYAEGPRKWRHHIEGFFNAVEKELQNNSIYRGKAFDGQQMPQFLDLSGVDPTKVIYSEDTFLQLDANIWSLMTYDAQMEALGVPLKRAVLLEGPYGSGKTLAAFLTAQAATSNEWSFLMCRPGRDKLFDVMATARLYQPAVVFFEDVDVVADAGSDHVSELLDIFDGIQAKGTKIIVVLTTNHVEKIHKGMMRPGRLDAVVHIGALDRGGIKSMVLATVPVECLSDDLDFDAIADAMTGFMPAFCREAIDRTVRYSVARHKGELVKLETADFVAAASGLRPQLELMEGAKDAMPKDALGVAMSKAIAGVIGNAYVADTDDDYRRWNLKVGE